MTSPKQETKPIDATFSIEFVYENARQELLELPMATRQRAFALLDRMKIDGPNLGMPHTRSMGEGLFEVRAMGQEGVGRVMYCTRIGRRIVVLQCFVKKKPENARKRSRNCTEQKEGA